MTINELFNSLPLVKGGVRIFTKGGLWEKAAETLKCG